MNPILSRYLTACYRTNVLHESAQIPVVMATSGIVDEIKAEIARIDALKLGANLAQRAFVDYQHRRALVDLLSQLERTATMSPTETGKDAAAFAGTAPPPPPRTGTLAATEAGDVAALTGTVT